MADPATTTSKADSGDDSLYGETGNDRLLGGPGLDTFWFGDAAGNDTIRDFGAGDRLVTRTALPETNGFVLVEGGTLEFPGGSVRLGRDVDVLKAAGTTADGGHAYVLADATPVGDNGPLADQLAHIRINELRMDAGAQPLAMHPLLTQAAQAHAEDLADGTAGSTLGEKIRATGYGQNYGATQIGGHIAQGHETWDSAIDFWQRSGEIDVSPGYDEAGLGDSSGRYVQTLGFHPGAQYITGVVYRDRDGDGSFDPGEGVGGEYVTIRGPQGSGTPITLQSGWFQEALAPGDYTLALSGGAVEQVTLAADRNAFVGIDMA